MRYHAIIGPETHTIAYNVGRARERYSKGGLAARNEDRGRDRRSPAREEFTVSREAKHDREQLIHFDPGERVDNGAANDQPVANPLMSECDELDGRQIRPGRPAEIGPS
jgi:hypothetical protein